MKRFVLTLGYSRRQYLEPTLNERVPQFLDAHERSFEHFGGHTREHLDERARTVCSPDGGGGVVWNATVADVRVHGTTHQPPHERFAAERPHLLPRAGWPLFCFQGAVPGVTVG